MAEKSRFPSPKERSEQEHEALKEQILDVVEDLLLEEGLEKLSIRSIAKRISYSPASLYHYYPGKDAIIAAVLARTGRRIGAAIAAAVSDASDPVEALREAFRAYIGVALEKPALARLVYLMRNPVVGNTTRGAAQRNPNLALLAELVTAAADARGFAVSDVDLTVRCLWTAAQGIVVRLALEDDGAQHGGAQNGGGMEGDDRTLLIEQYVEILIRGLIAGDREPDAKEK